MKSKMHYFYYRHEIQLFEKWERGDKASEGTVLDVKMLREKVRIEGCYEQILIYQ